MLDHAPGDRLGIDGQCEGADCRRRCRWSGYRGGSGGCRGRRDWRRRRRGRARGERRRRIGRSRSGSVGRGYWRVRGRWGRRRRWYRRGARYRRGRWYRRGARHRRICRKRQRRRRGIIPARNRRERSPAHQDGQSNYSEGNHIHIVHGFVEMREEPPRNRTDTRLEC